LVRGRVKANSINVCLSSLTLCGHLHIISKVLFYVMAELL